MASNSLLPSTRVFHVLELVGLICRHSSYRTQAQLLGVSRLVFGTCAPIVWRDIEGVHKLLGLLSGVSVVWPSGNTEGTSIVVTIPSDTSLERFDVYARFVERLEIYSATGGNEYNIHGWAILAEHAKQHALLPKLSRLTITLDRSISTTGQFFWIRMFISPSLNAIQVLRSPSRALSRSLRIHTSPTLSAALVDELRLRCPSIHTLAFFPRVSYRESITTDYAAFEFWSSSFYDRLAYLPLRDLSCTSEIFSTKAFPVLGQLPLLERLSVEPCYDETIVTIASLQLKSPPPLRHLTLRLSEWSKVFKIFDLNIFSELEEIKLYIDSPLPDEISSGDMCATKLMFLIASCVPSLTSLEVDFGSEINFTLTSPAPLRPLAALPLHHVSFKNLGWPWDDRGLAELHAIWPLATKIELPSFRVSKWSELYEFSRFQNLQHLVIDFEFELIRKEPSDAPTSGTFHILESPKTVSIRNDLSHLARHLLSFWPNLQRVLWRMPAGVSDSSGTSIHEGGSLEYIDSPDKVIMNGLNAFIDMHRAPSPVN